MTTALSLCHAYLDAKRFVVDAGFGWEVDWHASLAIRDVTEQAFLREYTWVVFNAGFRESTVRRIFPFVQEAFVHWKTASHVLEKRSACKRDALAVFNNERKVEAVLEVCLRVAASGFEKILDQIKMNGAAALRGFPFMGPATSLHLAKNLGLNVVKPDRHLLRLAAAAGYRSPLEMCETIHRLVGDPLGEIDVVLWRCSTLNPCWFRSLEANATQRSQVQVKGSLPEF